MTHQVLARKLRPQKFEDVVGQEIIVQSLQNASPEINLPTLIYFVEREGLVRRLSLAFSQSYSLYEKR